MERHEEQPQTETHPRFDASAGSSTIPKVLELLDLTEPTPVMVIIGGAGQMPAEIGEEVRKFFEKSLAPVLEPSRVVVLTGGTNAGVMAIAGETLSSVATLVGVSPGGALEDDPSVKLQTDHRLSVLTGGKAWGSETDYMVRLAMSITQGTRSGVVLLANGGQVASEEINYFVDAGWPILSIAGSGGAADDLIAFTANQGPSKFDWSSLKNADLGQVELDGPTPDVRKSLHWYVSEDEILKAAWTYYLAFDRCATRQQKINDRIRLGLQIGSLVIVSFVLIQVQANLPTTGLPPYLSWIGGRNGFIKVIELISVPAAVALPIALAAATAFGQSVAADRGWRLLRGAAESLKREIYRYRAWLAGNPGNSSPSGAGRRDLKKTIDTALRQAGSSGFLLSVDLTSGRGRPDGLDEGDDELDLLSVSSYGSHRIDEQIRYFRGKGRALRKRARRVVVAAVVLAAISGTIANTYFAPWAAMGVLIVTVLTAYLERSRLTDRATRYATASADLAEIKTGLDIETTGNLAQPKALLSVVTATEAALERESLAWEQLVWKKVRESV